MERRKLTSDETLALADRLSKLFPQSEWTVEQFDLFRTRISAYTHRAASDGFDDYRAECRFHTPVLRDLLACVAKRQSPHEQSKHATEIERMRESEAAYHHVKDREVGVSRRLHIPELHTMGRVLVERVRDGLRERMGNAENFSQRNVAGCPTWEELTDESDTRARILCWRYWIIVDDFAAYEPEVFNT